MLTVPLTIYLVFKHFSTTLLSFVLSVRICSFFLKSCFWGKNQIRKVWAPLLIELIKSLVVFLPPPRGGVKCSVGLFTFKEIRNISLYIEVYLVNVSPL